STSPLGPWVLSGLALAVVVLLLVWLRRVDHVLTATGLGLIIGGALGNVIDRVRFGAVLDFLDFHAFGWHWPAFNVADSAISVGAVLLLVVALRMPRRACRWARDWRSLRRAGRESASAVATCKGMIGSKRFGRRWRGLGVRMPRL